MESNKQEHRDIEIFPDFHYPVPPRMSGPGLIKRRMNQILQIAFSPRFSSDEAIQESMLGRYGIEDEVRFYKKYVDFGMHLSEKFGFIKAIENLEKKDEYLVIGSGAGREAFVFEKLQPQARIVGIDLCPQMVEVSLELAEERSSQVEFRHQSTFNITETFDFIWVTAILESHIQGRANRVNFYKELRRISQPHSHICMTPQFRKLSPRQMYFWGSQLLRVRWLGKSKWEEGDSVQAQLGCHTDNNGLVFSHYYPSPEHFQTELSEAGLKGEPIDLKATNLWLVKPL